MKTSVLKRFAALVAGGTPSVDDASFWAEDGGVNWVTIADMTRDRVVTDTDRHLTDQGLASKGLTVGPSGTLLFAMYASVGEVAVLGSGAAWNQAILGIEPRLGLADSTFVGYWLNHLRPQLSGLFRSNTQDNLNAEQVGNLPFPVVPVAAQRAIADYLDAETARIDALIEKKRRMIVLLEERFWEHVSLSTRVALSVCDNIPAPIGWRRVVLRRCFCEMAYGIGEASKQTGSIGVLAMANVGDGDVFGEPAGWVDAVDQTLLLHPGDLLFNRTNSLALVGKVGLFEGESCQLTFASYLVRLRTSPIADTRYLRFALNAPPFLSLARSTALPSIGQANLNPNRYSELRIVVPDVSVQREIARELEHERNSVRTVRLTLRAQLALLTERRQALITAAVTGELAIPGVPA